MVSFIQQPLELRVLKPHTMVSFIHQALELMKGDI